MVNSHRVAEVVAETVVPASIPIPDSTPSYRADGAKSDITIEMVPPSAADDNDLIARLTKIVNIVYSEHESGIYTDGFQRTNAPEVEGVIRAGELAVAYVSVASDDPPTSISPASSPGPPRLAAGCVRIRKLSETTGEFGMFAVDPAYQGGGLGRDMAKFAEDYCRAQGLTTMQLELVFPTWFEHAFKVRLHSWYTRMGYSMVRLGDFQSEYPHIHKLLRGDCEYRVFQKSLV